MSKYAGSDWVKESLQITDMSPLGESVADLLGDLFLGIYHLKRSSLIRVDWKNEYYISYVFGWKTLSSVDNDSLTRLVVLSHDRELRVEIAPRSFKYLELLFHQRERDSELYYRRIPALEDHIQSIRADYAEKITS